MTKRIPVEATPPDYTWHTWRDGVRIGIRPAVGGQGYDYATTAIGVLVAQGWVRCTSADVAVGLAARLTDAALRAIADED